MKKNILLFRFLSQIVLLVFLLLSPLTLWTCKEGPTAPNPNVYAGITGTVYDTSGTCLDSVRIFCLFNFSYYPTASTREKSLIFKINKPDTFGFNLYQNFPNPVQNTTFLRFGNVRIFV